MARVQYETVRLGNGGSDPNMGFGLATGSCLSAARRPASWVVVFRSFAATDGGGVAEFFFSGFFPITFEIERIKENAHWPN